MSVYEVHEHAYTSGPEQRKPRKPGAPELVHSHEGGDMPHAHPDTGRSRYGQNKLTKKPTGPQLERIAIAPERNTFRVIFVDEYTSGHASAGISRERWERERAAFLSIAAGEGDYESHSVDARMVREFRMTPIYEVSGPDGVQHKHE